MNVIVDTKSLLLLHNKIPSDLWKKNDLSILDPCCGNGNFSVPILFELLKHHDKRRILEEILEFNDINETRLNNVRKVFCNDKYNLLDHSFVIDQFLILKI